MRSWWLLAMLGCGGGGTDTDGPVGPADTTDTSAGDCPAVTSLSTPYPADPRAATSDDPATAALAADLRAIAASLLRHGAAGRQDNVFLGTFSLAGLLGGLGLDAGGATLAELDAVLSPGQPHADWLAAFAAYHVDLQAPPAARHGLVQHARALFHAADAAPGTPWTTAATAHDIALTAVDFGDPAAARDTVNGWAELHTNCQITSLFPPGALTVETRAVLVDAAVVMADWLEPFEDRADLPFTLADGAEIRVSTLFGPMTVGVADVGGVTVAHLPSRDETLELVVAVPAAPDGLADLVAGLDGPGLGALLDPAAATTELRQVELPALALEHRPDLPALLGAVGLSESLTAPELGSLCDGCDVVGSLVHEAGLTVNEQGFVAAAASGAAVTDSAAPTPPPLRIDRPFLVVVHDVAAGVPLFVGQVHDPREP